MPCNTTANGSKKKLKHAGRARTRDREAEGSGTRGVSRKTDRCQGNEGNLHFVKLSLESWWLCLGRVKGEDSEERS